MPIGEIGDSPQQAQMVCKRIFAGKVGKRIRRYARRGSANRQIAVLEESRGNRADPADPHPQAAANTRMKLAPRIFWIAASL